MADEKLIIEKPQDLEQKELVKAYKKLVAAFKQLEKTNADQADTILQQTDALSQKDSDLKAVQETSSELLTSLNEETQKANKLQKDVESKDAQIKQLQEDYETAQTIIEEQNASIEQLDEEKGTETGNFFKHGEKKIECRIPKFSVKGTGYTIQDLRDNKEITVPGKGGKPEPIGLTDYLLKIKSPILEIEE